MVDRNPATGPLPPTAAEAACAGHHPDAGADPAGRDPRPEDRPSRGSVRPA